MEDTLGEKLSLKRVTKMLRLNPCFNGRYSRSTYNYGKKECYREVLILVLMEDTLGVLDKLADAMLGSVLILVLMEDTLGVFCSLCYKL